MVKLLQSILLLIATAFKDELARQIKYLKVENEIPRSKFPSRIAITVNERSWFVRFGQKLGSALRGLVAIVPPDTIVGWMRESGGGKKKIAIKRRRRRAAQVVFFQ